MSELEKRLEKLEAHDEIKSCLTRYCRALDWVDEDLLKTCLLKMVISITVFMLVTQRDLFLL